MFVWPSYSAYSGVTCIHRFMLLINWGINAKHRSLGKSDTVDKNINTKKIASWIAEWNLAYRQGGNLGNENKLEGLKINRKN